MSTDDVCGVRSLAYLGLGVSDRVAWREYMTAFLGLEHAGTAEGADLYRMDAYSRRFIVQDSPADDILFAGLEVEDRQALGRLADRLSEAGLTVSSGSSAECQARAVAELIQVRDPDGLQLELVWGAKRQFEAPFRPGRAMSGFVTAEQGLGHIVLTTGDLDRSLRFYRDLLNFRISDYISITLPGAPPTDFAFLRCNKRHHTLALAPLPNAKRLQHFMVEAETLDDVGRAYDLALAMGAKIDIEIGRHSNDHMVSFYARSPSGFEVEYGFGARTVDEQTWVVERHDAPSMWGHRITNEFGKN